MKNKTYDMNGYTLHTTETDRFKTIGLKVCIRTDNKKEDDKYLPMLWRILVSTSSKYKTLKEINEACTEIYDPYYSIRTIESGKENIFGLSATFTNEKYTEKGMNEKNIEFVTDFIFKPKIKNDKFDEKIFETKKTKLIEYYSSIKDYPRDYASGRLEEEMISLDYKNYSLDEIIEITKSLTNEELYKYYKKIIEKGKLDIFVCGNFSSKEIKEIIKKHIKFKEKNSQTPNHVFNQKNYNKKPNIVIEKSSNVQSNLLIGCKVLNMTNHERQYAFTVYSWILGGGMNSLLNRTVREENSLCYYIYATRKSLMGIMKISAGIDGENFEKTYKLIKKEMKNIEKGNFDDELLEGVKKIYYNSLKSTLDYQDDMMTSHISEVFLNYDNIDKRKKEMEKITKEDIMNFAKKVHIDTVYLLKGETK